MTGGAGFGRVEISARVAGAQLVGYRTTSRRAIFVHDPLHVRALVLGAGAQQVAICSVELCCVGSDVVAAARARVERATGIPRERVFVSATHTHSGPRDVDPACWPQGLDEQICAAVEQACERFAPARVGVGWGMVHGVAMNRRRFEDPVDPAVLVVRVDDADGSPLGLWWGFGCHPVVLGPDNLLASGDWPASTARLLEERLGGVAVFGQGACADVNPLTAGVRAHLDAQWPVLGNVPGASYYGPARTAAAEHRIGNRAGGSFIEAERLGRAVGEEVVRVHRGIETGPLEGLWTRTLALDAPPARPAAAAAGGPVEEAVRPRAPHDEPLELMLVGIEGPGIVLVGAPVELFCESGVRLRRALRAAGVAHPFAVGYANGWRGYLPPRHAFAEGGYEVGWAHASGLPASLEAALVERVAGAVADVAERRATA